MSTKPQAARRPGVIYAVGDVHGCAGMLAALLDRILVHHATVGGRGRPRLVMLGDLIDRGPDSRGVVDTVVSSWFQDTFEATVLRGNHEDMMNEALACPENALAWFKHGGAETVESYGIEFGGDGVERVLHRFAAALPDSHRTFLASQPFSLQVGELFFCHAGIDPYRPLQYQSPMDLMWMGSHFLRHRGPFPARIVHGHFPTRDAQIEVLPSRIRVDTACGYRGGKLSAAAIMPDGSVQALSVGPAPDDALDIVPVQARSVLSPALS
jgi:serine/threonine protein phosphatase 1